MPTTDPIYDLFKLGVDPFGQTTVSTGHSQIGTVTEPVSFDGPDAAFIQVNDTVDLNGQIWTVTETRYAPDVDYLSDQNWHDMEAYTVTLSKSGSNDLHYLIPVDTGLDAGGNPVLLSHTDIEELQLGTTQPGVDIPVVSVNQNNDVSQSDFHDVEYYDMILTNVSFGDIAPGGTIATSDLIEAVDLAIFRVDDVNRIQIGDTIDMGGTTFDVVSIDRVAADFTYNGGSSVATSVETYAIEVSDGTNVFTYLAPRDSEGDLPYITQVDFPDGLGNDNTNYVQHVSVQTDNEVTLVPDGAKPYYDMIRMDGPVSDGDTLNSYDLGLQTLRDPLYFENAVDGLVSVGDTTVIGNITYEVAELSSFTGSFDSASGVVPSEGYIIELQEVGGTDTLHFTVPVDKDHSPAGADHVDLTSIQYDNITVVADGFISDKAIDSNDDVTLGPPPGVPFYDFIQTDVVAGYNSLMTTADGNLISVVEPLYLELASPSFIQPGDTTYINGQQWTVFTVYEVEMILNDNDGVNPEEGYQITFKHPTLGFMNYILPFDRGRSLELYEHIDITQIQMTHVDLVPRIATYQVDQDNEVTLNHAAPCFTKGTLIQTDRGHKPIEDLQVGDLVMTQDHGLQPIRWIGSSVVKAHANLAPIMIKEGALGNASDLMVSPLHRMLISDWRAELMFGEDEILVAAKHLINGDTIFRKPGGVVEYFHMMFDQHEIVYAEGCASESFYPGEVAMGSLDEEVQEEIFTLFPELRNGCLSYGQSARMEINAREAVVLTADAA